MTGANAGHEATTCKTSPPYVYYFGMAAVPSLALCLVMFFVIQKEWWMALIGWGVGINIMGFLLMNVRYFACFVWISFNVDFLRC